MELYANITSPLRAQNREDLTRQIERISPEYSGMMEEQRRLDDTYHEKFEEAKKALRDFMTKWREENPNAGRRDLYDVPEFNTLYEAEDAVIEEWTKRADELAERAKGTLTQALREAGYDGVFIAEDAGSWGRRTDAYIALDPNQVKNVDNRQPTENPDIRYSVDEDQDTAEALLAATDDGSGEYGLSQAALRQDTNLQRRIKRAQARRRPRRSGAGSQAAGSRTRRAGRCWYSTAPADALPPSTPAGGPYGSRQTRHTPGPTPPGPGGWSGRCRRRRSTPAGRG